MLNFNEYITAHKFFLQASELADELGLKLYIVGGWVRDSILGRNISEVDFVVEGDGITFASKYAEMLGVKNLNIFKNYGTAHFRYGGFDLEFVGARKESYSDSSRNPVVEPSSFEEDIKRRDFTVNAMAVSLNSCNLGELIDLYNGLNDIEQKVIKTPQDPMLTFNDDPLRIMRAFRFAAQLGFEVDEKVMNASRKLAERLSIITQERITTEFIKILESPKPSVGLILMEDAEIMKYVFPELTEMKGVEQRKDHHHKDVFYHTCKVVDNIAAVSDNVWLRFAALVHDIAKPATKRFVEGTGWTFHGHEELGARMMKTIFKRMKLPFNKLDYIRKLVRLHLRPIALVDESVSDSAIRRLIVQADEDLDDLITLCRADITSKNPAKVKKYLANYETVMDKVKDVREKDKLRAFQSPVRGEEIMQVCNLKPSKTVGNIKSAIEEAILEGKIKNTYEDAYNYLLEIKNQFLESNNN